MSMVILCTITYKMFHGNRKKMIIFRWCWLAFDVYYALMIGRRQRAYSREEIAILASVDDGRRCMFVIVWPMDQVQDLMSVQLLGLSSGIPSTAERSITVL